MQGHCEGVQKYDSLLSKGPLFLVFSSRDEKGETVLQGHSDVLAEV